MAAFDFPNNPAVGDRATNVGIVYIWDGQKWVNGTTSSSSVQTNCVVFTGTGLSPMYECLNNNSNIQISDATKTGRVWITQQGSIGVGTATPQYPLDVNGDIRTIGCVYIGSAAPLVSLCNDGTGKLLVNGAPVVPAPPNQSVQWNKNGVFGGDPRFQFNGGTVGIGYFGGTPLAPLHVAVAVTPGTTGNIDTIYVDTYAASGTMGLGGMILGGVSGVATIRTFGSRALSINPTGGSLGIGTTVPTTTVHAVAQDPALTLYSNFQNPDGSYSNLIIAAVSNATTNPDFVKYADSALITTKGGIELNVASSDVINLIPGAGGVYAVPITTGLGGYAFAVDLPTYNVGIGKVYPTYRLDVSTADLSGTLSTASQVHVSAKNTDVGGYITSNSDYGMILTGGAASNGTAWIAKAAAATQLQVGGASGNIIFYNDTGLTVGNTYTPTAHMIVAGTGNVGIGTLSPLYRLDVRNPGASVSQIHIANTDTDAGVYLYSGGDQNFNLSAGMAFNGSWIAKATGAAMIGMSSTSGFTFNLNTGLTVGGVFTPAQRMIINPSGYVGIGTSSPITTLNVIGAFHVSGPYAQPLTDPNSFSLDNYGGAARWTSFGPNTTTLGAFQFIQVHSDNSGALYPMVISSSANVGIGVTNPAYQLHLSGDSAAKPGTNTWTISSDIRTKQNVQRFEGDINVIRKLNPTVGEYNGKAQTPKGMRVVSFDADELKVIAPQCVTYTRGKLDPKDKAETDIAGINTHEIFFHLLRAVQQIDTRVQKLETK